MTPPLTQWAAKLVDGDRRALARSITRIESTRPDDRDDAEALIDAVLPHTGGSLRLGITGTPGVGKSTFIDALGMKLIKDGHRVAVLAVDPTSSRNGGSILGDKTRMAELSKRPEAFIRPSPSGGLTGGVARRTRDAMLLCEAAGFDVVIVETMCVGQAETAVAEICDLFLLLVAPGGGDDLQGIKRGIMELADVVAVNKADGALQAAANHTAADYRHALHMVRPKWPEMPTPVVTCSAITGAKLDELWATVTEVHQRLEIDGHLAELRGEQAVVHYTREFEQLLSERITRLPAFAKVQDQLEAAVRDGKRSPGGAAADLARRAWRELS
ncbi:MAG: methylmalonyl Co-A mutase-associated GTPase MeaB [Actinomycetota bacterium]